MAAGVVAGVMVMGVLAVPAGAVGPGAPPVAVQRGLDRLVRDDGVPGALASVQGRQGHSRTYTAGVGDVVTGVEVPGDGQVRVGSNTKTFTAVVVLQLVAEGKVALDASVETYLPGLLRGDGIDGRQITVRQLLQHTSGLPDYTHYLGEDIRFYAPGELLDLALAHEAHFAPGVKWEYNNTNYLVAGLLVEKVTGRSLAEQIERRVVRRIGLRHTYFPAPGEVALRERHPRGYDQESAGAPLVDATEWDPSWAWAAGQMVSTNSDLNRFFSALLSGRLLPKAQLDQMRTTVAATYPFPAGARYGLGLVSRPLSCGGVFWGHGGSMTGYETLGGVAGNGRAVGVAVTTQPGATTKDHMGDVVDAALCAR
ncbi:serine hydrolase domain-containing protein [Streptomyces laurentii]|uniref:serine hydrolase domain-containing protein n=1 Tax=Streptomyces laurentii TaxID=39478 RepID=UPI0036973E21